MDQHKFEKNIKDAFDQYQPDLDHDEIWNNIEPELKEKKKRRFFFWLLFAGMGAAFLFGYWGFQSAFENKNTIVDSKINKDKRPAKQKPFVANTETETPSILNNENQVADAGLKVKQTNPVRNTKDRLANSPKLIALSPTISSKEFFSSAKERFITSAPKLKSAAPKLLEEVALDLEPTPSQEYKISIKKLGMLPQPSPLKMRTNKEGDIMNRLFKAENQKKKKKKRDKKKKTKPLNRNKWCSHFQFGAAPILAIKSLRLSSGPGMSNYQTLRKKSETQLEAYGLNAKLVFEHKKGLLLMTGLEYQQLNERFDLSDITVTSGTQIGTVTVTEDADGNIIHTTNGPVNYKTTITDIQKIFNNYYFVNVPIGIGVRRNNKKYSYAFFTGLQYNLYFKFKGTIFVPDSTEPFSFKTSNSTGFYPNFFRPRAGFGFWLSGQYRWKINPRLSWMIAPKIQIPLSSLTPKDFTLKQQYYNFSCQVGINYTLKRDKK